MLIEAIKPAIYPSHMNYAHMISAGEGFAALIAANINLALRHCRIGKITLKS